MANVYTYNPKQVVMGLGNHIVSAYADDSFITVEPNGDGTQLKVGCDGEVNRAISVNKAYNIKVSLLQNSPTNKYLEAMYKKDQEDGTGYFPVIIKDLMGNEKFSADYVWVTKPASWGRGKDTTNREWDLVAAEGKMESE